MDSYAWLGLPELKEEILRDLAEDLARQRYVQGTYIAGANDEGQAFFGCHVGCLMMAQARYENRREDDPNPLYALVSAREEHAASWHGKIPEKLGMPSDLARFWDSFFEKLPEFLAPRFAVESLACVPVGADLRNVLHNLIVWLLVDDRAGFLAGAREPATPDEQQLGSYMTVVGDYWKHRAQDYTRSSQVALDPALADDMIPKVTALVQGIDHDVNSPYHWAYMAVHSALSGTIAHHVAGALAGEWVEAFDNGAITFPDYYDPFADDTENEPLWFIARKFFELCAEAPQGKPALA